MDRDLPPLRHRDGIPGRLRCRRLGARPGLQGSPPAGVELDVVGPALESPLLTGTLITPGAVDPRWHVVASWFSGITIPAVFAAAEILPEQPIRALADRDPVAKLTRIKARFDLTKAADRNDPRLVARRAAVEIKVEAVTATSP